MDTDLLAALLTLAVIIGVYFAPSIVAIGRNARMVGAVVIINLALGWTGIGWIVALCMAVSSQPQPTQPPPFSPRIAP